MRVFLDTNILVDLLLNRPAFAAESESLIPVRGQEVQVAEIYFGSVGVGAALVSAASNATFWPGELGP